MAESLTLLWYQTHSYAYMCPMEKMAFEENEHLAAFTEILGNLVYYNDSDLYSQLKQAHYAPPPLLLGSLDMDHSLYTWTHFNFFGWWNSKIISQLIMRTVMMCLPEVR